MTEAISLREKLIAVYRVTVFRPVLTIAIIGLSVVTALLEGVGLSFLFPIISLSQRDQATAGDGGGLVGLFADAYEVLGLPFSLETVVVGVAVVMTVRYSASFLVGWIRAKLVHSYAEALRNRAFRHALVARTDYFDQQGSDEILNAIVTQAQKAGNSITVLTNFVQQVLLSIVYLAIAMYIAPVLTVGAAVVLGVIALLTRGALESGYTVGDRIANANERLQTAVQAGMQGIRDVKLFGMEGEMADRFRTAARDVRRNEVVLVRNTEALRNFYQLLTAVTLFALVYVALRVLSLSLASLGVFLFAMFRLAPRVSTLNQIVYNLEGQLPHALRTQRFIRELQAQSEPADANRDLPSRIDEVTFDDVSFAYDGEEQVFDGLSLSVQRGNFVALVGPSGAGKSTIVSLLTRMYEPEEGEIRANGIPIREFDVAEWRERVSVVRQDPYIFNDTLRANVTIGRRDATQSDIERVCDIAHVTEFLDDLPDGYDTVLGDDGVRLSGGQRQRVALARSLLKDADLLLLDEATSDLDTGIEERVHRAIESLDRDYAMLVIAHRLSTVVNADTIHAMEDGRIVESGTHGDLVDQQGVYARLYDTQSG